jgi:transcriptional regulator with XRE-family HTH domain
LSDIVDNLRILMKRNGVSAYRIERDTDKDLKQSTISRILNENRKPRPSTIKKLADYFSVTVGQLLGEEPLPDFDVMDEYRAGAVPEGCDPEIWAEVPERINEMNLETLAQFAECFVREASLDDPHDQRLLKEIYYIWLKQRKEEGDSKKSIPVEIPDKY